jgi:dsRNA-specific ribonuclease
MYLPTLEMIRDEELLRQSRTTMSWLNRQSSSKTQQCQRPGHEGRDNFRTLEWLGDAVLYQCTTEILMERWPFISVESLTVRI